MSCCMAIHDGQKLYGNLIKVKQNFVAVLLKYFANNGWYSKVLLSMFVNMDKNAALLESTSKSIVHYSTVSRRCSSRTAAG